MKDFNIFWGSLKNLIFRAGITKNQCIRRRLPKEAALQETGGGGVGFLKVRGGRGLMPQCTI